MQRLILCVWLVCLMLIVWEKGRCETCPYKIEVVTVYLTTGGNWAMIFVTTSSMSRCICMEVS
jgi:hypothetical protein